MIDPDEMTTADYADGAEDDGESELRAPAERMPPKRGSAAPSEEYYEAQGLGSIKLRLRSSVLECLDDLAESSGTSRTCVVERLVIAAHTEQASKPEPTSAK